ncbi:MAG: hypothetical protein JKY22_08915 [Flavobacteriaceae bacterium]|nr:hypothetical protein [Flavobacteriaceae bacterium]
MTGQKKKRKASKIKSFLFFLLLALVFWVLTKFSEENTAAINANLVFTNLPSSVSISSKTTTDMEFDISANGFEFLSYNMKTPTINIDVSRYYEEGDTLISISGSELGEIIITNLGNDIRVGNLSLKTLSVHLDVIVSKKVPITFISEVSYREGYKMVGAPILIPDSVVISGPSAAVELVGSISTETYSNEDVSETQEGVIGLHIEKDSEISLSKETVSLRMVVEEFAQKRLTLPVQVINVPQDIKLKLLPENIVISFDVSVNQFNNISENDFKVVCDFALQSFGENILAPKLVEQPDGLYHIDWSTKKVEYLIFK